MIGDIKMTEENDKIDQRMFDREMEDIFAQIILACGVRPLKEKVSILLLTVDYIYANNKELEPCFSDEITLH